MRRTVNAHVICAHHMPKQGARKTVSHTCRPRHCDGTPAMKCRIYIYISLKISNYKYHSVSDRTHIYVVEVSM